MGQDSQKLYSIGWAKTTDLYFTKLPQEKRVIVHNDYQKKKE